jgi:hypothetical protein
MPSIEKLRLLNEKSKAKEREEARKRQQRGAKISQLSRAQDTRRKVLAGSWALDAAEKSPDFHAQMMRALDKVWLWRDDDRTLFGFALLSDDEKARRELAYCKAGRKKEKHADASASRSDSSADAPATHERQRETEAA